uniref:KH domain-containing protein n=1 Tax=Strongyloides stercoralis TaxID=6248 RepID=A0A0K0DZC4_STRER
MDDSTIYERITHNDYLTLYLTNAWKSNGWILSQNDYETFQKAYGDDFVCYVAYNDESKQFYGIIWGLFNRNIDGKITLFSVASFFVLPLYRGKGIGRNLFDKLMNHAEKKSPGVNMYLTSVNDMKEKYSIYGFVLERNSYIKIYTIRFNDFIVDNNSHYNSNIILKKYTQIEDWQSVFEYDRKFTTPIVDRSKFLKLLFTRNDGYGRVAFDGKGNVVGFIHIRECLLNNLDIGPFFADKQEIAKSLLISTLLEIKLSGKRYSVVLMKLFSNNNYCEKLINEITNGKIMYNENMYAKFTKSVIPTREMLVYSMTEYTLSHI